VIRIRALLHYLFIEILLYWELGAYKFFFLIFFCLYQFYFLLLIFIFQLFLPFLLEFPIKPSSSYILELFLILIPFQIYC